MTNCINALLTYSMVDINTNSQMILHYGTIHKNSCLKLVRLDLGMSDSHILTCLKVSVCESTSE